MRRFASLFTGHSSRHKSLTGKHASRRALLCALSAVLLVLAFPKTDAWLLAWVALVPLMFALDGLPARRAFKGAYMCGLIFNIGVFYWFIYMSRTAGISAFLSWLAMIALCAYLSLYFGLFGLFYSWSRRVFSPAWRLLVVPAGWVGLEWLREHLFSGFGWACLGYSQYRVLPVIQIADITGVFGISFVVLTVNVSLKEALSAAGKKGKGCRLNAAGPIAWATALVLLVLSYGFFALEGMPARGYDLDIALVQGNIDQDMKWDPYYRPQILAKYFDLTRQAARKRPDVIIWPETSFPGYSWDSPREIARLQNFVAGLKLPLLLGMISREGRDYYNTAFLYTADGQLNDWYHKRHLVPFGEYLPLRRQLPFLQDLVPIEDFTSGDKIATFKVPSGDRQHSPVDTLSVLICFEDTVARVARSVVRSGARALVNMTNDAWFLDTKEPYLHLQSAVLRCVENRRDMARAANTGISCVVDSRGAVRDILADQNGDPTYVAGVLTSGLRFQDRVTFYTKFGDAFTYFCFGGILIAAAFFRNKTRI